MILELRLETWAADRLLPAFEGHYLRTLNTTVGSINNTLGLAVDIPDMVGRSVIENGGKRMGLIDLTEDTKRALFRSLHDGRILGEGPPALASRIRAQVPAGRFVNAGPQYWATMIARTETKWAQNVSSLTAYESTDAIDGVIAFDNQTGFNDADCTARDGQVFTIEEAKVEQEKEHPNGTLSWAPNVVDPLV